MSRHWLFITEPDFYSYDDLERDQGAVWGGVSNQLALKNLRDVRLGDQILIYHAGNEQAVVGMAEAVTDAYPDPAENDEMIVVVDIKPKRKFAHPVLLAEIRASDALSEFDLTRTPPPVMAVSNAQWDAIQEMLV
ncbi:MAG: EVE domain-containing protein [Blastocatellales bacterium]